jgi:GNAT superfamily N-acetyltransferase
MSEEITVRLAIEKDIEQILELAEKWHPTHEPIEKEIRREKLRKTFEPEYDWYEIWVAETNQKIIGWFDIKVYKDWFMLRYVVHIDHMFVTSEYRNKGIGTLIMNKIKGHYEEVARNTKINVLYFCSEGSVDEFFLKNEFRLSAQHYYIYRKQIRRNPLGVVE